MINRSKPYIAFSQQRTELLAKLAQAMIMLWGVTLLAQWSWQIVMPESLPSLPPAKVSQNQTLETITASHWFGAASNNQNSLQTNINFKLVGIFAPSGTSAGFAIIKTPDGKQHIVIQHEEIAPGTVLTSLGANFITITYNGDSRKIEMETQPTRKQPLKSPALQPR